MCKIEVSIECHKCGNLNRIGTSKGNHRAGYHTIKCYNCETEISYDIEYI